MYLSSLLSCMWYFLVFWSLSLRPKKNMCVSGFPTDSAENWPIQLFLSAF